jgi:hypothetical protein
MNEYPSNAISAILSSIIETTRAGVEHLSPINTIHIDNNSTSV